MYELEYLHGHPSVALFRDWLSGRLQGAQVGHPHAPRLIDARDGDRWPLRQRAPLPKRGHPYAYPALPLQPASSKLEANQTVLDQLQIQADFQSLAGVVAAIFYWAGVYTTTRHGGNKRWLAENAHPNTRHLGQGRPRPRLQPRHQRGRRPPLQCRHDQGVLAAARQLHLLRQSSGRFSCMAVSALVARRAKPARAGDASGLRFGCPPANRATGHRRVVHAFPILRNDPHGHHIWNVRANRLLADALRVAGPKSQIRTLRELEAALFQMGGDLA